MNRKQEINGKPEKEANKDLHYKVTVEHSRVFCYGLIRRHVKTDVGGKSVCTPLHAQYHLQPFPNTASCNPRDASLRVAVPSDRNKTT
jgi:hypothetical protein